MRKITLAAAAALTAASAMAASPVAAKVDVKPANAKKFEMVAKQSAVARFDANAAFTGSRAATATNMPLYATPASFYNSMDSEGYTYTKNDEAKSAYFFSLVAPNAKVPFISIADNANPVWNWSEYVVNEEQTALVPGPVQTATDDVFELSTSYISEFTKVTYTGTIAGSELTWSNTADIMAGRSFGDWGVEGQDGAYFGGSPASAPTSGNIWGNIFSIDRTGAEGYNPFGVSVEFATSEWGAKGVDPKTVKLDAFGSYIPAAGAPFQLRGLYFLTYYASTEKLPLTISVYNVDKDGKPDMSTKIGGGEIVLPASEDMTSAMPKVEIKAMNILGYTSDAPVVSDGTHELYVTVEGFNEDFVKQFVMLVSKCSKIPQADWSGDNFDFYRAAYPVNLNMRFSGTETASGETVELTCPHIHAYGDSGDKTILWMATDFQIYYDIYFPCIFPAFVDQTFDVEIPAEGGEGLCPIDGYTGVDSDIAQLWEDAIIDGEVSDDWISYEVAYSEPDELSYVAVSADALPAGEVGRKGTIKFSGYGCDFTITVNQGDVSGINSVAAAANGNVEFFDLQGRKLGAAPANGLYIERNGTTAATKLAR
ncbi:MAG: hypothetical protein K2I28_05585 [Muribaculaceae bacterium]|nr:hypothetical protein [Muribaculaceae bacterium]